MQPPEEHAPTAWGMKPLLQLAKLEPTYGLAAFLVLAFVAAPWALQNAVIGTILVAGVVLVVLVAIVLVELRRRRSLLLDTPSEQTVMASLNEERKAAETVLGGLADSERDLVFVYSHTPVTGFHDHAGHEILYEFSSSERRVTTIPDAIGISKLQTMLHIAGRVDRINVVTSDELREGDWANPMILIGSRNSNWATDRVIRECGSPFLFADDMASIIAAEDTSLCWPNGDVSATDSDYALLAKLIGHVGDHECMYLVVAGIGPTGTLGACHYLSVNTHQLADRFDRGPFACVLEVPRGAAGYTRVKELRCEALKMATTRANG